MGIYSQKAGWGLVYGKLRRGNIRGGSGSDQTNLTGFMPKADQGDQIPSVADEFDQIWRVMRYQWQGILSELT